MAPVLLLLALAAAPAQAPAPAGPAAADTALSLFAGVAFRPVVGDWAEYAVRSKGQPPQKLKVSVVGVEPEPVEAHWLELQMDDGTRTVVFKLLTVGHPGAPGAMRRLIAQLGPGMVVEFPLPPEEHPEPASTPTAGQPKKVKVPAGTFMSTPLVSGKRTTWVALEAPIFGVVKGTYPNTALELVRFGKGATSAITSPPQRLGIPLFPGAWGGTPPPKTTTTPAAPSGNQSPAPTSTPGQPSP